MTHIVCLTARGGLPLFTRKRGDCETLAFSVGASLNGVDMFGASQSMLLQSTSTCDTTLVWSEFEDSIKLIGAANEVSETVLRQLLTSVFHAMVMAVGLQALREPRNVDSLKRDLRACIPLVDSLLECIPVSGLASDDRRVNLLGMSRFVLSQENASLQWCLDSFAESWDCVFGWLMISGQVVVATLAWWQLEPDERQLLAMLVSSDVKATARDIPVFLPRISPNVPFRLVSCSLVARVEVCLICGPTPDIAQVEDVAVQCWQPALQSLTALQQTQLWILPSTIQIDSGVLGILLVDRERGKYSLCRRDSPSASHRLDVLQMFYYTTAVDLAAGQEAYWCAEYHKCHAMRTGDTLLCSLYAATVPVHTMRVIAQHTMDLLTLDKQICWSPHP